MLAHLRHRAMQTLKGVIRSGAPIFAGALVITVISAPAEAQSWGTTSGSSGSAFSGSTVSASTMWATTTTGSDSNYYSALMHQAAGETAAGVEMARKGILYLNGASITVTAVGSQNIISTTIIGDDNSVGVNADQTATNTGDVTVHDVTIQGIQIN